MHSDAVLAALDPEQRAVAETVRGPLCVLAGAGTGKTRAITHRIAYAVHTGVVPPAAVLAVTYTARAAGEMRARLHALEVAGVQARTFHSAALRQLAYFWPRVVGGAMPQVMDSKLAVVGAAAARAGLRLGRTELRDVAAEIEWAKVSLLGPEGYAAAAAGREPVVPAGDLARVYAGYETLKRDRGLLDFEDLLMLTAASIEEHPDVAAEVRARYRYFVVDEYQDVNPLQQRLLVAWLGGRDDVCVVGDPNQTIYSFTGASPSYLLDFARRHPGAAVVRLVRDYRSTPEVVALANAVLARAPRTAARLELVAQRPAGPAPSFEEYDDEPAEAAAVAGRIRDLLAGGLPASQVAVLFRTNAQSEAYESALGELGVAYLVRGGERFFQRPEVREAVVLLRGAARSPDAAATEGLPEAVRHVLSSAGWGPTPPAGTGAVRERWESLAALVRLAEELTSAGAAGLGDFVEELDQRAAAAHAPTVEGVTLASLHAAKGLEWDAVFLIGLADGTVPITYAVTPEQVEEERRLFYVGVTRAREHLALSWARSRSPGGRGNRRPSRFLDGIAPVSAVASATVPAGRERRRGRSGPPRCRVCGRALVEAVAVKLGRCTGCPGDLDEALFTRLREWRLARAGEQKQPAFCVFTDATLTAIAERRPTTVAELVAVPGVGQAKLDRYGADVLALVAGKPPA